MTCPRIIGLDLSIAGTAIAFGDGDAERVHTTVEQGDWRLVIIRDRVAAYAADADLAVIEDLPFHAHAAGVTGMVQGVVRTVLLEAGVPYVLVVGTVLKKYATGSGQALKSDLRMALYQRLRIDDRDDNRVDARWLLLMGRDHYGHPLVRMPAANRAALGKVHWPALVRAES